jgi:two-component system sensor kinase FixL
VFQALANSERHFRVLIEQAVDGILVVDGNGIITLANSSACEMSGYGPDEILGLDLLDTYPPAERELGLRHLNTDARGSDRRSVRAPAATQGRTSSLPIEVGVALAAGR